MNFAPDPILGQGDQQLTTDALLNMGNEWGKKFAELQQRGINIQPQQTKTPIWDEIDKIMDGLTETQKGFLNNNQEFVESYQEVAGILQREELRLIRPVVEQTKDGKDALERHLTLIKRLRKSAMQAEEKKSALWEEYITKYGDMPWKDFMAMKNAKKGGNK